MPSVVESSFYITLSVYKHKKRMMYYIILCLCIDFPDCDGSPCQQMCVETDGSFQCSCTSGYLLANDGRGCNGMLSTYT